jgi:GGDEF domain-containing protein
MSVQLQRLRNIINRMSKRFTTAFTIFSVIVFVFLIVWFVFRAINTRTANILDAQDELSALAKTVSSSYLAGGSFGSAHFRDELTEKIDQAVDLRALVVSAPDDAIEYLYAALQDYIPNYRTSPADLDVPPSYSYNALSEEHISTTVIVPALGSVRLNAVFVVFGKSEVYPIIRELLIGLLSFLLITAILIVLYPAIAKRADGAIERMASPPPPRVPDPPGNDSRTDESVAGPTDHQSNGLYSPATGLTWERHMEERLNSELKRAASFDQDLVLLLISLQGVRKSEPAYVAIARLVREFFNFEDLCFEFGKSGVAIIVPNLDIDQGIERAEDAKLRMDEVLANDHPSARLHIGMSARSGRLISGMPVIREAKSALGRAQNEAGGIVAFRVDPERYREFMASQKSKPRR